MPEETMHAWVIAIGIYEGNFDSDNWRWRKPDDDKNVDPLKPVQTIG